ncbi:glycosyltransferase [Acidimicrobiaceae bacterium]|nr:glycosyltransferase [Acidimicrobiaceae bacterium]
MNDSIRIMYLFVSGRKNRLNVLEDCAKEFFYSYNFFKDKYIETDVMEFNEVKDYSKLFKKILKLSDRIFRKMVKFPIFMSEIVNKTNFNKIINSDVLVITNDRIGCSIIPIMLMCKLKKKRFYTTNVFVLGLFSNLGSGKIQKFFQRCFLNLYFSIYDNFIFIGKAEYEYAKNYTQKYSYKFRYIPFCIDTEFWNKELVDKENDILFVGNDGNRDFKKVIEISKILNEYKFIFVTNQIKKSKNIPPNVEIIEGHWNYNYLSDKNLKEIYEKSRLSIIPLKDSLQPSGQSVTLQSMSLGIPVLISKTVGFWDFSKFRDEENIFMITHDSSPKQWAQKITTLLQDKSKLSKISENGENLIKSTFNLEKFNHELEELILGKK